jgi:hypothetical protein
VRLPFLPGVTDTTDPTYTVIGSAIAGYISSLVSHVCATVPTVRHLIRFCQNGFKMPTQPSPSNGVPHLSSYSSTSKRSHKSIKDYKERFRITQQRSKDSPHDTKDPYRISAIMDAENDDRVVELSAMESPTHTDALTDGERSGQDVKSGSTQRVEEQLHTIVRESPSPGLDDSASNKSILHQNSYP